MALISSAPVPGARAARAPLPLAYGLARSRRTSCRRELALVVAVSRTTARQREEHVVETRLTHGEVERLETLTVERAQALHERARAVRELEVHDAAAARRPPDAVRREHGGRAHRVAVVAETQLDDRAAEARLELGRCALR